MQKVIHSHTTEPLYKTLRGSNNRDCSPSALEAAILQHGKGSCVDFPQHKAQSALCHGGEERDREGNVRACVISIRVHFQQNRAIFTVSASTDLLRWPLDGRKTDELRYLASGGCFSAAPRQTRFLPSSLFHVSCSPALSTWKQQIRWLENKARLSLWCLLNLYYATVAS